MQGGLLVLDAQILSPLQVLAKSIAEALAGEHPAEVLADRLDRELVDAFNALKDLTDAKYLYVSFDRFFHKLILTISYLPAFGTPCCSLSHAPLHESTTDR